MRLILNSPGVLQLRLILKTSWQTGTGTLPVRSSRATVVL